MTWVALRMLMGDTVKYLGMVFGVAFSTLLITQQASLFVGLVRRAGTTVSDVQEANVWVMDPRVTSVDKTWPMPSTALEKVRGVEGVAWASPLLKRNATLVTPGGRLETTVLLGVDDATLLGLPQQVRAGNREELHLPGAVFMDEAGYRYLFPGETFKPGRVLELNDTRAVLVGLVEAGAQFSSQVTLYARYGTARNLAPGGRNSLDFVLARAAEGRSPEEVAQAIEQRTGLKAASRKAFVKATSDDVVYNTGIPINFGTAVGLGIIVGMVIVALTFTLFIRDNLKQFGALKAIGLPNRSLMGMVMLQGGVVGLLGYGLGLGAAGAFIKGAGTTLALRGFFIPWQVASFAAAIVVLIMAASGFLALRKVLTTDPASVFRG